MIFKYNIYILIIVIVSFGYGYKNYLNLFLDLRE